MIESDKRSILSGKQSSYTRLEQQRISHIQGSVVIWTIFILLLVVAIAVILMLPGYVDAINDSHKPEQFPPQYIQPNSQSPDELLKLQGNIKSAESLRQQIINLKIQLEVWDVAQWGREKYHQALKLEGLGDQQFHQEQILKAEVTYKSAVVVLEELAASRKQRLQTAIITGEQALDAEDVETARLEFNLALSIEPGNRLAENGMDRVVILEQVTVKLRLGNKHEDKGQLSDALAAYKEALAIDPDNIHASQLLARVEKKITNKQFRNAMTNGYLALEEKHYVKARHSFKQAQAIKLGSAEVRDALELVAVDYNLVRIRKYKTQAEEFERKEQWQDAEKIYQTLLELDNTLEFALEGKKRSQFYIRVNNDMDYIIQHSDRLASEEPYNSAVSLLRKVQGITPKGNRLEMKIIVLEDLVKVARILVPITLESDGKTDIVVYKVGKLGRFSMRTLNLNPGQYTAVGSCPGYQDVRKVFTVLANQPKVYFIRCEEVI